MAMLRPWPGWCCHEGAVTGQAVEVLDFGEVRLRDGLLARPVSILTTSETGLGVVSLVVTVVPEGTDVTSGTLLLLSSIDSIILISEQQFSTRSSQTLAGRKVPGSKFPCLSWTWFSSSPMSRISSLLSCLMKRVMP